jgi:RND family efflux transporter MFP subunit
MMALVLPFAGCNSPETVVTGQETGDLDTSTARLSHSSDREAGTKGYLGVVVPRERVDVAAESEGKLASVSVRLGDRVKQGGVIATIDPRDVQVELASAQASLEAAQAELLLTESQAAEAIEHLQRRRTLSQILSAEELRQAEVAANVAAAEATAAGARVKQLETAVQGLRQRLADTVVRAPFTGVVAVRYVDSGKWIARGTPIVALNSSDYWIRFAVPESEIELIRVGSPVSATVWEGTDQQRLIARVLHIAPEVDSASAMITVEAELQGDTDVTNALRSGGVVRVFPEPPAEGGRSSAPDGR